jgi:hypothetical protein
MAVNLGNDALASVSELRSNPEFRRFVDALGDFVSIRTVAALNSPHADRVDTTAYVRGLYDIWLAIHSHMYGTHVAQVKPRQTVGKGEPARV